MNKIWKRIAVISGVLLITFLASVAWAATTTYQGRKAISTTGTRVALAGAQEVDWVIIVAGLGNDRPITIGSITVTIDQTSTDGPRLEGGDSLKLGPCDLADVYINGKAGNTVYYVAATGTGTTAVTLLGTIDDNTDDLEGYVDGLEGYVDGLEGYVDGIEGTLTTIDTDTGNIAGYVDGIEGTLTTIDADTGNLDIALTTLRDATKTTTPLGWSYSGEKGVATSVIKASAGMVHAVLVETDGANSVTIQVYDHASTATNPVTPSIVIAGGDLYGGFIGLDAICSNGIVLVLSGTNGVATVMYK